jgi:hypothetical protein
MSDNKKRCADVCHLYCVPLALTNRCPSKRDLKSSTSWAVLKLINTRENTVRLGLGVLGVRQG